MSERQLSVVTAERLLLSSWADLTTPENQRVEAYGERQFRKGYYYAVADVIDALGSGVRHRQLRAWLENALFEWAYPDARAYSSADGTPAVPEPWHSIRKRILRRDGGKCRYCGRPADEVDHVVPIARGGSDDDSNLVAACGKCNREKHAKTPEEWGHEVMEAAS